jgi:peptidoglycan-N-acetylglucosamine deacetylase
MASKEVPQHSIKFLHKLCSVAGRNMMGTITHVLTQDPVAALTFDDGPHPEFTPRLLDILERHAAPATFFMLGEAAQRYPELVRRIAATGHAIGNHSWDHPSFPLITGRERREQIRACGQALLQYGQRLFRPPYGQQSAKSRLDALWLRYTVVTWSLEVGDWWDPDTGRMLELLLRRIRPGSIVLLHDSLARHPCASREPRLPRQPYIDRQPMLEAVNAFLEKVSDHFHFITIPELLRQGHPQRQNWYRVTPAA